MAFVSDPNEWSNKETIDHERNIILRKIPHGLPDPEYPYELEWHGQIVKFRCEKENISRHQTEDNWEFETKAKISMVEIPEGFPETKKAVINVIEEAITVYYSHPLMRTRRTEVEFSNAALRGT